MLVDKSLLGTSVVAITQLIVNTSSLIHFVLFIS